jgi:two-component system, LytTR family, response regulator
MMKGSRAPSWAAFWLLHPEIEIAGEARNGEEALELIARLAPDLLFLDIQMPGMTGFELLERLDDMPQVIFTTAYDQYAIHAFEINALDYLLKPIAPTVSLPRCPGCARVPSARVSNRSSSATAIAAGSSAARHLPPRIGGQLHALHFGSERPLIRRSLNALEEQLDPNLFFRAGRKEIINLKWIDKVDIGVNGGLTVTLRGGVTVDMSRRQSIAAARDT